MQVRDGDGPPVDRCLCPRLLLPACLAPGGFTQRNKRRHLFCSLLLIKLSTKCPGHRLPCARKEPRRREDAASGSSLQLCSHRTLTHSHTVHSSLFSPVCCCNVHTCINTCKHAYIHVSMSRSSQTASIPEEKLPSGGQNTHLARRLAGEAFRR